MKILNKIKNITLPLVFWIFVWQVLSMIVDKEVLLPSPIGVIRKLTLLFLMIDFHKSVLMTLMRVVIGYLIGTILGSVLAVISFYSKTVKMLISPLFSIVRATPVASFIILALVWLGRDSIPTFTAILMVMPIVYANTITGMSSSDKNLLEVAKIYKFSGVKKLRLLYLPSAVPSFLSGAKTSLGLAWKSAVAAEVLCNLKTSIGGAIYSSKNYLETTELFAWTLCVIILSLILEKLISVTTSSVYIKYTIGEVAENAASN